MRIESSIEIALEGQSARMCSAASPFLWCPNGLAYEAGAITEKSLLLVVRTV